MTAVSRKELHHQLNPTAAEHFTDSDFAGANHCLRGGEVDKIHARSDEEKHGGQA